MRLAILPATLLFALPAIAQILPDPGPTNPRLQTVAWQNGQRIILTALLSPLFCVLGLVGPIWAVVCLTIPVALEALVSGVLAAPVC